MKSKGCIFISKLMCLLLCIAFITGFTGCMSFLNDAAVTDAEDTVESFINDFLNDPERVDYDTYFVTNPKFSTDDRQEEVLESAIEQARIRSCEASVSNDRRKASVVVRMGHCYDISALDESFTIPEEYTEAIDNMKYGNEKLVFKLVRNSDEEWVIQKADDFTDLFMTPYEELDFEDSRETEPTGTQGGTNQLVMDGVSNLAGYMSSYVYTAWYNVEMDTPVDSDVTSAEDAYALKNVFYFDRPVYGDFTAVLMRDDSEVATIDVSMNGEVTCECDFSAPVSLGITNFETGEYKVVLRYDGHDVVYSDPMTVR